jgi:hypothetical protein
VRKVIDAHQAVQIAQQERGEQAVGVWANDDGFVVGFAGQDPYDNLPVFVDAQTGQASALGADEYAKIMPSLHVVA